MRYQRYAGRRRPDHTGFQISVQAERQGALDAREGRQIERTQGGGGHWPPSYQELNPCSVDIVTALLVKHDIQALDLLLVADPQSTRNDSDDLQDDKGGDCREHDGRDDPGQLH